MDTRNVVSRIANHHQVVNDLVRSHTKLFNCLLVTVRDSVFGEDADILLHHLVQVLVVGSDVDRHFRAVLVCQGSHNVVAFDTCLLHDCEA